MKKLLNWGLIRLFDFSKQVQKMQEAIFRSAKSALKDPNKFKFQKNARENNHFAKTNKKIVFFILTP